jgi:hypothetical protein
VDGSELVLLDLVDAVVSRTDYLVAHCFIAAGAPYPYTKTISLATGAEGAGCHEDDGAGETAENGMEGGPIPNDTTALRCTEMLCEITVGPGYLKADLFNRQTVEETRDALVTITAEARKHKCSQILIAVHASRPIFKIEQSGVLDYFKELGDRYRVALTADSNELRLAQQYIESVARRSRMNVRSFPTQQAALDWFKDRRWSPDRRQRQEEWGGHDRRQQWRRRLESSGANFDGGVSA